MCIRDSVALGGHDDAHAAALAARDWALLELLYATGARISELVSLDGSHVDAVNHVLTVTGKGNKQRRVPYGESAGEALALWGHRRAELAAPEAGDAVFVGARGARITPGWPAGSWPVRWRPFRRPPPVGRTACGTALRPTCWTGERTCAPCRKLSLIHI